jgi:lantibiotic biosynthesis protein
VVISPAKWRFSESHLPRFSLDTLSNSDILRDWLIRWKIPNRIQIRLTGRELYFDLSKESHQIEFIKYSKNVSHLVIEEFLFVLDDCVVKNKEGSHFVSEMFAFYLNKNDQKILDGAVLETDRNQITFQESTFIPGDEWIFLKLYSNSNCWDKILTTVVVRINSLFFNNDDVKEWFFVKYSDPQPHIRLRYLVPNAEHRGNVLSVANKIIRDYVNVGLIRSVEVSTYVREFERYRFPGISIAEKYFRFDSDAVLQFLTIEKQLKNPNARLLFALSCIDQTLSIACIPLSERIVFLKGLYIRLLNEFPNRAELRNSVNLWYRKIRHEINDFLCDFDKIENKEIFIILESRRSGLDELIKEEFRSSIGLKTLASYLHMTVNRIAVDMSRLSEMNLYYALIGFYTSACKSDKRSN